MTYNIVSGGQNAWQPLNRNGDYKEGCDDGLDPNAPVVYYVGTGPDYFGATLLFPEGTELRTNDGVVLPPQEHIAFDVPGFHTWHPYDDGDTPALYWRSVLRALTLGYLEIDGQRARIEPAAVYQYAQEGGPDGEDQHILFTALAIEDQITGVMHRSDVAQPFTGTTAPGFTQAYFLEGTEGALVPLSIESIEIDEGPEKVPVFIAAYGMTGSGPSPGGGEEDESPGEEDPGTHPDDD